MFWKLIPPLEFFRPKKFSTPISDVFWIANFKRWFVLVGFNPAILQFVINQHPTRFFKILHSKVMGFCNSNRTLFYWLICHADNRKTLINGTPMSGQNRLRKWLFLGEQKDQVSAVNSSVGQNEHLASFAHNIIM